MYRTMFKGEISSYSDITGTIMVRKSLERKKDKDFFTRESCQNSQESFHHDIDCVIVLRMLISLIEKLMEDSM